jgi:hypothetical protein
MKRREFITLGHRLQTERHPVHESGLISRDLISAAPLHLLSDLRDDVDARGFL